MKFKTGDIVRLKKGTCQFLKDNNMWGRYMDGIEDGMIGLVQNERSMYIRGRMRHVIELGIQDVEVPYTIPVCPIWLERP